MTDTQSTVLVAEDSQTQSIQFRRLLEKAGFRALMTANGREALDVIRRSPPDVVVTDLDMPEMNGLELVEAVHRSFPNIPVVLATAVGSEEIAAEALRKGAASYVPKQFLADLIPTLHRLLAVTQADRANTLLADCATYSEVRYTLTNDETLVVPLVAQIRRMIERFGIRDGSGALRVAMAFNEALQNAIVHGNLEVTSRLREGANATAFWDLVGERRMQTPFSDRRIHVQAILTNDFARIVIRDEGPGFDPATIPDPTNPAFLDRPCGRGLWLIHTFMDEVRHNREGNEITLVLHRPNPSSAPQSFRTDSIRRLPDATRKISLEN